MQPQEVDDIVKLYKRLAQVPALIGAKIGTDGNVINSVWSQRNLEKGKTTKFMRSVIVSPNFSTITEVPPVDISTEALSCVSPSGVSKAVLREADEKQFLEIWSHSNLVRSVDLNTLDIHGNVYTDGEFSAFEWSADEKRLLYVAEKKIKKSEPFYKRKGKKSTENNGSGDDTPTKGEEYVYRQDWGEQLVGKKQSVICQYEIENDNVEILTGIPDNICPARPVYSPDGSYIVGVAYRTDPRKLGLIYCTNRPSTIFRLDFKGNYVELALENSSVKAPRFSPDGKKVIWLQRKSSGPHAAAMSLMKIDAPFSATSTPSVVIDIIRKSSKTTNEKDFYGLYNTDYPKRCWSNDGRLLLSTAQKTNIRSYVIDIEKGQITELEYPDGSQVILDVYKDHVVVNRRNFLIPDFLVVGKLPARGSESQIQFTELTEKTSLPGFDKLTYKNLEIVQPTDDSVKNSTAIYLGPSTGTDKSVPLIVWPHGGPHGAFGNYFFLESALFMSLGYGILLINYRGSTGAGQDNLEYILGKIGTSDVADCVQSTQTALKEFPWLNPNQTVLVGGSHGGFLVTHLSGQYPDMFKAVVARNPVIDVASMSIISDIPDWSYEEMGYTYTQLGKINDDMFLEMRKASPIEHAHKVKAPTLLQIGSKDLRVPMHQGIEYYHRLRANCVKVRMNLYDDNHPLGTVPNELDNLINTVLWLEEHGRS